MLTREKIAQLKSIVESEVFVTKAQQKITSKNARESNWLFDFRTVLMKPEVLALLTEIFLSKYKDKYPFQLGCLEVAGIPFVTGLSCFLWQKDIPVNAFFIRKSRKKHGLLNMIEGRINDEKIILVDDIINSGQSFMRQVEVVESLGKKVDTVFSILQFRDDSYYSYFHEKGIRVESLFTLDDFADSLEVKNLVRREETPVATPFQVEWCFKSEQPNYFYVVPKSAPVVDETRLYFGSDSGNFWALNQNDGSVAWKFKVGLHAKGKSIFSSPVIFRDRVYFGSYDGNFYALNKETGAREWIFMEADWIGSSPCLAEKHKLIYVGLEFGLFKKRGGVAALDAVSGAKRWEFTTEEYVHSSPAYNKKFDVVVCGSNNNMVYALAAKTGKRLWEFATEGPVKASFAFYEKKKYVIFGSHDSYLYIVDVASGVLIHKFKTGFAIYATPLVYQDQVYVTSLDKKLYCINLVTLTVAWEFLTSGRIFASPEVVNGLIYIGANDGRLYELQPDTGYNSAVFQTTERITNKVTTTAKGDRLFVPTFANEMYCLTKKE